MALNPRQQAAVDYGNGPLLIIAGAGSGKTKTLTSRLLRILESGVAPDRILAITFTNKAAEEMRKRILDNTQPPTNNAAEKPLVHRLSSIVHQPFIGTFHSFGARLLRKEAGKLGRTAAFTIFDDDDSLSVLKKIVKAMKAEGMDPPSPALLLRRVYGIKNNLQEVEYEKDPRARAALSRYEKMLEEQNAFDFGDLIEKPVRLFRNHEDVRERHQGATTHILVDEYQDVNPAQYELVKLLAAKHRNLAVVGDDAQAIYGWRDADVEHFLRFPKDWPDAKIVKLEQNYRSTKTIITGAGAVVGKNSSQHEKNLWTENPEGNPIKVVGARDAEEEAEWIAGQVTELMSYGPRPTVEQFRKLEKDLSTHQLHNSSTIAILYRTNAQSRAIEQALIVADIPYRIFGGVKFYERKEVKDVLAALRFAANPRDMVSRERLDTALGKRAALPVAEGLLARASTEDHIGLIQFFLSESRYFSVLRHDYPNAEERIENINELIAFAGGFPNLQEFLERASLLQSTDTPSGQLKSYAAATVNESRSASVSNSPTHQLHNSSPVSLMTIHMAKGLEFDRVFVAGVSEGILPHQMSYGTLSELEEERRLMYVAMTRAREELTLTFYKIPSRFLYEIPPELVTFESLSGMAESLPEDDIIYLDE